MARMHSIVMRLTACAGFFCILFFFAGCAYQNTAPYTPEEMAADRVIYENVEKALGDYTHKVSVEVKQGIVTLRGMLVDRSEQDDIMRRVQTVKGVRFIRDEFEVQWDMHDSMFHWGWPGRR